MAEIVVVGLGNLLLGDDGIGPRVIRELQRRNLPAGVKAVEAGGSFYHYWDDLLKCRYVIAVDSMLGGGPPGSVYLVTPELAAGPEAVSGLRHEIHFVDVLKMATYYGVRPKVAIVGVEPEEINFSLALSPTIAAKLPGIVNFVVNRFLHQGVRPPNDFQNGVKRTDSG